LKRFGRNRNAGGDIGHEEKDPGIRLGKKGTTDCGGSSEGEARELEGVTTKEWGGTEKKNAEIRIKGGNSLVCPGLSQGKIQSGRKESKEKERKVPRKGTLIRVNGAV